MKANDRRTKEESLSKLEATQLNKTLNNNIPIKIKLAWGQGTGNATKIRAPKQKVAGF